MQSVARMALQEGMELAEDVVSIHNGLILKAHTKLDKLAIAKLARYDIMCVPVMEPEDYATTHYEKIALSKVFKNFETVYQNNLSAYKYMIQDFIDHGTPVNTDVLLELHANVKACVKDDDLILDMLYSLMPTEDNMTYAHCFNSALIASCFADWIRLTPEDKALLTLCGYFYDIGKLKLPGKLIWKPGKLSDFEYNWMKTHTTIGYDLMRSQKLDPHILNAILMHHERCDGSGYPNKLKRNSIDPFARYIAIVDSYEAMTSARTYRAPLNPFQVFESFEKSGIFKYDDSLLTILSHIAGQQVNRKVVLNNDTTTISTVRMINPAKLSRPIVELNGEIIYLANRPEDKITAVL